MRTFAIIATASIIGAATATQNSFDQLCATGIQGRQKSWGYVCCPQECSDGNGAGCGGSGCSSRGGATECCGGNIKTAQKSCSTNAAPCVVTVADVARVAAEAAPTAAPVVVKKKVATTTTTAAPTTTTTTAFSASNPRVCSDVTCSMVVPHTCAYSTSNYGGSVFSSLIGAKHGANDGCAKHGVCNGAYQWAGAAAKTSNHACDGSTHKSMRITHNGKAESVCLNGHRCKIGLASGTANCECVPVCEIGDVYVNGDCRSRNYQYNPGASP